MEHYVPITEDARLTFTWDNLLWVCPECNRRKVNQFPRDLAGSPLVINPVDSDPWTHLILDTATGRLAPRYVSGVFDARGEKTLEVLAPLNFEAVTDGRLKSIRRLRDAVGDVLLDDGSPALRRRLRHAVEDDDFGVAVWFAVREGGAEPPFWDLRHQSLVCWRRFVAWATVG